jgi:hypothetical protein
MSEQLTDEQLNDQNLAHIPGQGPSPIDTHGESTPRTTVAHAEIAAGAAQFDPTPPARFQPVTNDWQMHGPAPTGHATPVETFRRGIPMDTPSGEPSGCRVTPIAVGSDSTGK